MIIIVLVGAFALSGSNNQGPSVSPTVSTATSPTPTTTPGNGGGDGGTPSVTPSETPSVTPAPSVTPTPEPESGVRLTEFGYWVTYPPLGPQTWSSPPPAPEGNVVYFTRSSDVIGVPQDGEEELIVMVAGDHRDACVHRGGNLSETVTVTIRASSSDNIHPESELASFDGMYAIRGDNVSHVDGTNYTLTFGPGVGEDYISVYVSDISLLPRAAGGNYPSVGFVKLTITNVDNGYSIGSPKEFTLDVREMPTVYFELDHGDVWYDSSSGEIRYDAGEFASIDNTSSADMLYVFIDVSRETSSGGLSVSVDSESHNIPASGYVIYPFAFVNGESTGQLKEGIYKSYIYSSNYKYILLNIVGTDYYASGDHYRIYDIEIND